MENKHEICNSFLVILQNTRGGAKIVGLDYDELNEIVTITYLNGHTVECNVAVDSGCTMMCDILQSIIL